MIYAAGRTAHHRRQCCHAISLRKAMRSGKRWSSSKRLAASLYPEIFLMSIGARLMDSSEVLASTTKRTCFPSHFHRLGDDGALAGFLPVSIEIFVCMHVFGPQRATTVIFRFTSFAQRSSFSLKRESHIRLTTTPLRATATMSEITHPTIKDGWFRE